MGLFDYCLRLKVLVDELRDVGAPVSDATMLTNLIRGLGSDYANAASNLNLLTEPTFARQLLCASRNGGCAIYPLAPQAARHRPLPAAPSPTPGSSPSGHARKKKRGPDGRPRAAGTAPAGRPAASPGPAPAPWFGGVNPWTGVVHAWALPPTRAPHPGILGSRPASHQALLAAPGGYPSPPPTTWPPALPAHWLGHSGAPSASPDPTLLAALHQAPSPATYSGNGDWFMDTGASSHMASHLGPADQDGASPM
ncbi:hypothetical protein ZWY2020_020103 [Hordeum vulgare]|nr:hypothetical protein ZWY2020_020103 [Hordeum vulgare]